MDAMFAAMAAAAVDRDEGPVDPAAVAEPAPLPPEEDADVRRLTKRHGEG